MEVRKPSPRNLQRLGYRRIVTLLVYLVIVPTVLILSLGIVLMFLGEARFNLLLGILTVSFVSVMATGYILVLVFLRRQANLSELQADFVSKVSHELKTPLTAIRLLAETMERSRDDAKTVDRCLGLLIEENERLTGRIERLLTWGRMEAGRAIYDLRETKVAAVLDDALDGFSPARIAELNIRRDDEAADAVVMADRAVLADAILNLLTNAEKYGGSPPEITVRSRRLGKGQVAVEVSDNGSGIQRREQRRIFDKFYRIDDRLSRAREGSGLGLAIVKHVVRGHGGKIEVDSEEGRGSTFRIVLPAALESGHRPSGPPEKRERRSSAPETVEVK